MRTVLLLALSLALAGCGDAPLFGRSAVSPVAMTPTDPTLRPPSRPAAGAAIPTGGAQTAAALDTTTEAERAAAVASPAAAGAALGQVSVALGSPADQGFWLQAALVRAPGKGRVELPGGASVAVDLRPGQGAALLSLAAYRSLGLSLTDLPVVTVYAE
jgi:hypothetical protein